MTIVRVSVCLMQSLLLALTITIGSAFTVQAGLLEYRDDFLAEVHQRVPEADFHGMQPGIIVQGVAGERLQAWGTPGIDAFYVKGVGPFAFTGGPFGGGQPSGISLGRWRVDGIRVRVYDPNIGFEQTFDISLSGEWNKDPASGYHYDREVVVPDALKAKLKHGQSVGLKTDIISHGRMSADSLPLDAVRQFARQKIAAAEQKKQAEETARQRAEAERQAAEEKARQETQDQQQAESHRPQPDYGRDDGYDDRADRERRAREARERRERRMLEREANQAWDTYQNVLKDIGDAFKVDPEIQRQREREAEREEWEYEQEQRRLRQEEDRYWQEQERLEAERAEREREQKRKAAEEQRQREEQHAAYRANREREKDLWARDGRASRYFDEKFKWMNNVADSLVLFDRSYGFEGQDASHYKKHYAHPKGLNLLLERALKNETLSATAKASLMNSLMSWYLGWVRLHQSHNFYADTPSCPTCRTGEIVEFQDLLKLFPYLKAWNNFDIDASSWGTSSVPAPLKSAVTIDKLYEAGSDITRPWSALQNDLDQHSGKIYPDKIALILKPAHVAYLEDYLNADHLVAHGSETFETRKKLKILNLLIAHHMNGGEYSLAYLRLHEALVLLGMRTTSDLFERPVHWRRNYKVETGPAHMLADQDTTSLLHNAAYVYLMNGHFAESEYILRRVLQKMSWPFYNSFNNPGSFNYFDLTVTLTDILAHKGQWDDVLKHADKLEADYRAAIAVYAKSKRQKINIDKQPMAFSSVRPGQWGLHASRRNSADIFREAQAYRALAYARLGNGKEARKALSPLIKALAKSPDQILGAPHLMRILNPLLLELAPKDHKKYLADKNVKTAPLLSDIALPVTRQQMDENNDLWYERHKSLLYAHHQHVAKEQFAEAENIAIQLAPTMKMMADRSSVWGKQLFSSLYDGSLRSFRAGRYLQGMAFADIARRVNPDQAERAEFALALNALFGNYNYVRLEHFGPWKNHGTKDGKTLVRHDPEKGRYYLAVALQDYGRTQNDGNLSEIERLVKAKAQEGDTSYQMAYLLNVFWRTKNPWAN